jgi:hypothetical protein
VFVPDFAGGADRPEQYARAVSGIETAGERPVLPVFLKYLRLAAERMEEGLVPYRAAALASSPEQRAEAVRQVAVAEQLQRMLESCHAVLAFEDLRRRLAAETDAGRKGGLLDRMEVILRDERARTELSLLAATRDARLGFQCECDYVYTPYSLRQKLASLQETLEIHLARRRARIAAPPAAVAAAGRPSAPA